MAFELTLYPVGLPQPAKSPAARKREYVQELEKNIQFLSEICTAHNQTIERLQTEVANVTSQLDEVCWENRHWANLAHQFQMMNEVVRVQNVVLLQRNDFLEKQFAAKRPRTKRARVTNPE